jgi:crossover junction endodeoxyribonuclease RusA
VRRAYGLRAAHLFLPLQRLLPAVLPERPLLAAPPGLPPRLRRSVRYTLSFPPGTPLINVNTREHYRARAKVTAALRAAACVLARSEGIPPLGRIRVRATYYPPDRRRRDSSNVLFLSLKAALDGITDAGVLSDDNDKIVLGLELFPGDHAVPGGQMVIELTEVEE